MTSKGKVWVDGPLRLLKVPRKGQEPVHASTTIAIEMCHVHNCLIRGLNSVYLQAPHVHELQDITDFLFFCQSLYKMIEHHHHGEETIFFPGVELMAGQPGLMAGNLEQHAAFHAGLDRFNTYAVNTAPKDYDSAKLLAILNSFADDLYHHLADEIPSMLSLSVYDSDQLAKIWNEAVVSAEGGSKDQIYPLAFGTWDKTFEGGPYHFPPVPFFVNYLVHYWFERAHAGAWRFLPCDTWGNPRPLKFLN